MGLSRLSIWVRDTAHPCLPYEGTGHNWAAIILSCDLQPLHFGAVHNGVYHLTEPGKAGGRVHGQVKVPPGCYIVLAVAGCKNVFTDWAMVQVGCDQGVCVNLLPKRLTTCTGQLIFTLKIAEAIGPQFRPSSPPHEIPPDVVSNAIGALEDLDKHLPEDVVLPALPITLEDVIKMGEEG